jgi:hypothetical protein
MWLFPHVLKDKLVMTQDSRESKIKQKQDQTETRSNRNMRDQTETCAQETCAQETRACHAKTGKPKNDAFGAKLQ